MLIEKLENYLYGHKTFDIQRYEAWPIEYDCMRVFVIDHITSYEYIAII